MRKRSAQGPTQGVLEAGEERCLRACGGSGGRFGEILPNAFHVASVLRVPGSGESGRFPLPPIPLTLYVIRGFG